MIVEMQAGLPDGIVCADCISLLFWWMLPRHSDLLTTGLDRSRFVNSSAPTFSWAIRIVK
ncbi:MAG: hypothetical protein ACO3B3_11410 [Cyanobium sp.]